MPKESKALKKPKKTANSPRKKRKIVIAKPVKKTNLIDMDGVLRHISAVQLQRKTANFAIESGESFVVNNLLRDAGLEFTKTDHGTYVVYEVVPGPEKQEGVHALAHLEELDDEVAEDGQVFG